MFPAPINPMVLGKAMLLSIERALTADAARQLSGVERAAAIPAARYAKGAGRAADGRQLSKKRYE
jgi:hypothetical protein